MPKPAPYQSGFLFSGLGLWFGFKLTSLFDRQAIVFGKVHDKVECSRIKVTQSGINNNAFHFCNNDWSDIRRVSEAGVSGIAWRAKAGHYPAKTFGPITGAKWFARGGNALNEKLFVVQVGVKIVLGISMIRPLA